MSLVPIRYVEGEIDNVVPVETVLSPGIGVVDCEVQEGPDNVVPVREAPEETPRVLIHLP